jgi:putative transposase
VNELAVHIPLVQACPAVGLPRSTFYRLQKPRISMPSPKPKQPSPRALSAQEQATVLDLLNSDRFQDQAPREVYATLLDEGIYVCHWRSMYRVLSINQQVSERRDQLVHPTAVKPELVATAPNHVWSWDITKLLGPTKHTYYYLYVILDVYSRYVPGWLLADRESEDLATQLVCETCVKQHIPLGQLTLHADHGGAMTSKSLALLLADLGVTKSHSRPRVSNDNRSTERSRRSPYSEAQFKTMKYRPDYPEFFDSLLHARAWAQGFFPWYNHEHKHSALCLLTPAVVHYGQAEAILRARHTVRQKAYAAHPERFVKGPPVLPNLAPEVWINRPQPVLTVAALH